MVQEKPYCGSGQRQVCAAVFTPKNSLEKNLRQWWCLSVPTMFAGREKTAKSLSVSPWVLPISSSISCSSKAGEMPFFSSANRGQQPMLLRMGKKQSTISPAVKTLWKTCGYCWILSSTPVFRRKMWKRKKASSEAKSVWGKTTPTGLLMKPWWT